MLKHIVLVKLKPRTRRAWIEKVIQDLKALPPRIAEIRDYEVTEDILHTARSFDLAIIGEFDDVSSLKRYQQHPAHVPVLDELLSRAKQIASLDYEVT